MAIQFVGGANAGKAGATSGDTTIALNTGLAGGIASAVAANDLVIAAFATGSVADRTLAITTDYTLIASELYQDDTFDINLRVAYKFMTATPDTTTTFGPTGDNADSGAMAVYVFRGVNIVTPLDVTAVTGVAPDTSRVVPPDITPITAGAFPVVIGGAAHNGGVDTFTSSDLTDFQTIGGSNDTNDVTIGLGHQDNWTSGATNFATWGHSQTDSTSFSWAAITIALRPGVPFVAELTTPDIGIDGQSLTRLNAYLGLVTSPSFAFTGQSVTRLNAFYGQLSSASFVFTGQSVTSLIIYIAQLTLASFNFTAQSITRLNAYLAQLSASSFSFVAQSITRLTVYVAQLSSASFSFAGNVLTFIFGSGGGATFAPRRKGNYRITFYSN